jgi:hypothetical protein
MALLFLDKVLNDIDKNLKIHKKDEKPEDEVQGHLQRIRVRQKP